MAQAGAAAGSCERVATAPIGMAPPQLTTATRLSTFTLLAHGDFAVGANNTQGALSADARYAACGGSSGTLFVWESAGDHGAPVRALQKHQSVVTGCCWGKTGQRVMSVDARGYLVVWE